MSWYASRAVRNVHAVSTGDGFVAIEWQPPSEPGKGCRMNKDDLLPEKTP